MHRVKRLSRVPLFLISYDESLGIASNTGKALENDPMAGHYHPSWLGDRTGGQRYRLAGSDDTARDGAGR
jgi:hypothetical protein